MPTEMIGLINKEPILVKINDDGRSAIGISDPYKDTKFLIKEIMLGMGKYRKSIPFTRYFLQSDMECNAEIIKGNKIRII